MLKLNLYIKESRFYYGLLLFVFILSGMVLYSAPPLNLMPVPEKITASDGTFRVDEGFSCSIHLTRSSLSSQRTSRAMARMLKRLSGRTGLFFKSHDIAVQSGTSAKTNKTNSLTISFQRRGKLELHEDESYTLQVKPTGIVLKAVTDIGIIRGLETLLQLLGSDESGYYFPAVRIDDKPRFPWRGLMIDPCRHFMPVAMIKRNLDAMAIVKLNVLHWHLSEDQGFRIECKTFPKLHQLGSDGLYYTHEQVKDVIAYAADRGIRVMPEFDIPGHSTSWAVGYPELMSAPGPYTIQRRHGVFDPTFDPTKKATYKFFKKFFKEMCALFPDAYMHIGGDENNGKQWKSNASILKFMKKKSIKDNHQLQAYFNKKILKILTKYGKKMMGWDEIFQPELPKTIVIHSWRGKKALRESAKKGYNTLLSNGYYIDLAQRTDAHYLNDPIPQGTDLTESERKRILGGEATMWAELITNETVDSRIWPRTAAIAERFWSPANINDVRDMYRRLDVISVQLEESGVTHLKNRQMILRRLTGGRETGPLQILIGAIEPLKGYKRHRQTTYTFFSPFSRLVDAAVPDPVEARQFRFAVEDFLKEQTKESALNIYKMLKTWRENHSKVISLIETSPVLKEIESLSAAVARVSEIGIKALHQILGTQEVDKQWREKSLETLNKLAKPMAHADIAIISAIRKLVTHK